LLLYRTLRFALRSALGVFFVDIESTGEATIPERGPVIFAANHPNSIMDTVILGTRTPRTIHYMARSGLFKNPVVAWIFNRCGVIPVYRKQDDPSLTSQNESAFEAAFEVLRKGGCIGIFPEGQNAPERRVRDLKTGTARIALGALDTPDPPERLLIVPVGLNFENRDRFLSRVLVRFAEPIDATDFLADYAVDPRAAARALTDQIQERLRCVAVHILDNLSVELVEDIQKIYGHQLLDALADDAENRPELHTRYLEKIRASTAHHPSLDDTFYLKQRISDAVDYFLEHEPTRVDAIRQHIRAYKEDLDQAKLRYSFATRPPETLSLRLDALKLSLYAVFLAPVFLWGVLNNLIPFKLTGAAVLRADDEAKRAFTGLTVGTLLFNIFLAVQTWAIYALFGSALGAALYAVSVPLSGLFALRYWRQLARYRDRIVVRTLFLSQSRLLDRLLARRKLLLDELESLRETFMLAIQDAQEANEIGIATEIP